MASQNQAILEKLQSEAIPSFNDTSSFLADLAQSLIAVQAAHVQPPNPSPHPRPHDVIRSVLRGDIVALKASFWFEHDKKQRIVRLFISSTFTDTVHERAILLRCVHPAVQQYARKLNFEVIFSEMRFGIRDSLSDNNKTSEACMIELERCADESASISYMLFLRNKYGFRPPPRKVPRVDLDAMMSLMPYADKHLVQDFYQLDENILITPQACYRLLINMHGSGNIADAAYVLRNIKLVDDFWLRLPRLQKALREAASLHWPNAIKDLDHHCSQHPIRFFFFSVTEEEICRGVFWKDAVEIERSVHVFDRPIEAPGGGDLSSLDPNSKELLNFVDVVENQIDAQAHGRLVSLRQMLSQATLHAPSIVTKSDTSVRWLDGTGFHHSYAPHAIDLQKFAYAATVCLLESLDRANECLAFQPHPDMAEVLHHMKFAHERSLKFSHSSETRVVATKLRDFVASASGDGHAFVMYGASGSGKTSLMAAAADEAAHALSSPSCAVIVRFLGTSPASSNLVDLLSSLCRQLHSISATLAAVPASDDVEKLKEYFEIAMKTWPTGRLTVFLDSLDQLDDTCAGRKLNWLPTHNLSPNVRLVVSTLPDEASPPDGKPFACLSILQKRYVGLPSDAAFAEVQPIEDVQSLLLHFFRSRQRLLTDIQLRVLVDVIKLSPKTQTPLVVAIVSERFSEWPSHQDLPSDNKNHDGSPFVDVSTVRALIIQTFKLLEEKHGANLVQAALSFITLAKDGVSETELSEILSLDDDVLASVYQWWVPPVRTLPTTPLTMLLADLKPYLTRRGIASGGSCRMMRWYHRQFWEAADEYFLHDADKRRRRHTQLGEFFLGVWAHRSKPYNDKLKAAVQTKISGEETGDRNVRSQPLCLREGRSIFETRGDACAVNERRCREAVHHLLAASMLCEAAEELCSFEGICARARCGEGFVLLQQLLQLGSRIREQLHRHDARGLHCLLRVEHYARWLRRDMSAIAANPEYETIDACSRQPEVSLARKDLKAYLQETSGGVSFKSGSFFRSFVLGPIHQDFDQCASELKHHRADVRCVAYNSDGSLLVSASADTTVAIWNTNTGIVEGVLKDHTGDIASVAWAPDDRHLVTGES